MIKIYHTNVETGKLEMLERIEKGCWIDLVKPNHDDILFLTDSLDVDTSFISYLLDDEEQPRIDYDHDKDIRMIIVDVPIHEKKNSYTIVTTIPLAILIIKDSYMVTVSLDECDLLQEFKDQRIKEFYTYKKTRFTIQLLYRTATSYLKYLRNLNGEIEQAEFKMLKATSNRDLANLLNIEKSLVYMVTSLRSNKVVLERILKGNIIHLYEEDNELLEDAIVENKQCIEMANLYREILSSTTDSYATIISNNLNTIMKFLAGITIVISIPTMVASFMGMNVPLGFLMTNEYAFWILFFLSLMLSLIVAYILKKKNML
ncbi:MAG: magnesium transporter CorA family protein [bacterium]|nr:magnesium transporter CorA family protein [bacterium]